MAKLALKDEMVLNVDGVIPVDPAIGLRERAKAFIAARTWSTPSIYYGDQPEPEASADAGKSMWSLCLCLGLDHVRRTAADWFSDVAAIIAFIESVARETGSEFIVEIRLSSRLWYSETLAIVSGERGGKVDLGGVRSMLEHFLKPNRDDRFVAKWGHTRVFGKRRFIVVEGILWSGLPAAFCLTLFFGYGFKAQFNLARCIFGAVAGLALGYGVASWRWSSAERRFRERVWKPKPRTQAADSPPK